MVYSPLNMLLNQVCYSKYAKDKGKGIKAGNHHPPKKTARKEDGSKDTIKHPENNQ